MFSRLKEINSGVIRLLLNLLGQLNLLQDSVSRKSYGQLRPHVAYLRIVRERVLTPQLPQLLLQELHQPQSPTTQLYSWHRRLRRLLHPSVWSTITRAERTTKNQSNFDITALSSWPKKIKKTNHFKKKTRVRKIENNLDNVLDRVFSRSSAYVSFFLN